MNEFPQIFAFYSFKGGVGRSMAVLNLAYALAAKGRHVLVLDMDLEAPGLSGFLHREKEIAGFAQSDMVDLVLWASLCTLPLDPLSFPALSDYVVSIPPEKLEPIPRLFSELGRLDIIPVEEERDYYNRLASLSMGNLDQSALVQIGSILRAWLKNLRFPIEVPDYYGPDCERIASYDYVLVDSRTGITETGGLCIGPLSDQLVVLSALNDQNVEGTRKFLEEVGVLKDSDESEAEAEPKPCLIVASLVPSGEIETKRKRLKRLEEALGPVRVKLSYHPQLALKESIFTRDHRDEYLAREYDELLQQVLRMASDGEDPDLLEAVSKKSGSSAEFRETLRQLTRSASVGSGSLLYYLLSSMKYDEILEETDYILWDRICRVLSSGESPFRWNVVNHWAVLLSAWSQHSVDPELVALRWQAAMGRFEQVLQAEEASLSQKITARYNRGVRYGQRGQAEEEIADFSAVIDMADAPAEPRAMALVNRGVRYGRRGEAEKAIADFSAVIDMANAPAEKKAMALVNRGWRHFDAGRYQEAISDDWQAISLSPNYFGAHGNLGIALLLDGQASEALAAYDAALVLSDLENLDEMTEDLREAIEKHGPISRAEDVMARLEARRQVLCQRPANNDGAVSQ
jgi:MinD-like ATPase involved in chromosome partitioning or flagellar assembly/lipoprotein NlpI